MTALINSLFEVKRTLIGKYAALPHGYITTGIIHGVGFQPVNIPTSITFEGAWRSINLANGAHWVGNDPNLPDVTSIKGVRLDILIAITCDDGLPDGNDREFRLSWRAAEDDPHNFRNHQSHAIALVGGIRSQSNIVVPVRNGVFHTYFKRLINGSETGADFSGGYIARVSEVYY